MLITEVNLYSLLQQYHIAPIECFDTFSITLHLDRRIIRYNYPKDHVVSYGRETKETNISAIDLEGEYILHPGQAILACSKETVKMPNGYFGLIQTKGSLARLFISAHCCDGQIEPGFEGKITFELCNLGPLNVRFTADNPIAQLFIFKTSSDQEAYHGKYNNSCTPTYSK